MGSKWHWKLSAAQRRMLREVEKNPEHRPPKSTREADRFWRLVDGRDDVPYPQLVFITIDLDTGDAIVHPKGVVKK